MTEDDNEGYEFNTALVEGAEKVGEISARINTALMDDYTGAAILALMGHVFATLHINLDGKTQEFVDDIMESVRGHFDTLEKSMRERLKIA